MIFVELREPHIVVVTRGGIVTGAYQNRKQGQAQVRPMAQKKASLDVYKEKEVFLDVCPELVDANQPSISGQINTIPKRFKNLLRKQPMQKVSKLKDFFKICLAIISDKNVVAELTTLIEENPDDLQPKKRVYHIRKRLKTGR